MAGSSTGSRSRSRKRSRKRRTPAGVVGREALIRSDSAATEVRRDGEPERLGRGKVRRQRGAGGGGFGGVGGVHGVSVGVSTERAGTVGWDSAGANRILGMQFQGRLGEGEARAGGKEVEAS